MANSGGASLQHQELLPLSHGDGLTRVRGVAVDGAHPPAPPVGSVDPPVAAVLGDIVRLRGLEGHRGIKVIILIKVGGVFILIFCATKFPWNVIIYRRLRDRGSQ